MTATLQRSTEKKVGSEYSPAQALNDLAFNFNSDADMAEGGYSDVPDFKNLTERDIAVRRTARDLAYTFESQQSDDLGSGDRPVLYETYVRLRGVLVHYADLIVEAREKHCSSDMRDLLTKLAKLEVQNALEGKPLLMND